MSETISTDLLRQLRQHLESLQWAGVEWLPRSREPLVFSSVAAPTPTLAAPAAPPAQVDPLEKARLELKVLAEEVAACTRCGHLASTRTQTVFGVGRLHPELCFVGEAPGADEDAMGEPFVGAAGQLLNRIISACGFRREDVYICNIIKCRPPGNRTPNDSEAANCNDFLTRQLELVAPRYICALGGTAAKYLLNTSAPVGKLRGKVQYYGPARIPVVCTYHPAYLLGHRAKNEEEVRERKKLVWEDMKFLLQLMGRPREKQEGPQ